MGALLDLALRAKPQTAEPAKPSKPSEPKAHEDARPETLSVRCPEDLRARIWDMAQRWGYSPEELAYALQKAAEDPAAWRDFVADDERWCATKH
jgi:hypothetical protein